MRKLFPHSPNFKFLILLILTTLFALTFSVLRARTRYESMPKPALSAYALARPSPSGPVEAELITCTARGLEPAEITRSAGRFLLRVDNRSEMKNITLRLLNNSGQVLREKQLSDGNLSWRELLDLPSGSYTISEINHPDWSCQLTIIN